MPAVFFQGIMLLVCFLFVFHNYIDGLGTHPSDISTDIAELMIPSAGPRGFGDGTPSSAWRLLLLFFLFFRYVSKWHAGCFTQLYCGTQPIAETTAC